MKFDPKYFNAFILAMAVILTIAIIIGTISYRTDQREIFVGKLRDKVALGAAKFAPASGEGDSLSLSDIKSEFLVLDFGATWSPYSERAHRALKAVERKFPGRIHVVSAMVKNQPQEILEYERMKAFQFTYVLGTDLYRELSIPGIPSHIVFDSTGNVVDYSVGFSKDNAITRLESLLTGTN